MSEKKYDEEKLAAQSIPGVTVVLDTSGEGHSAINDQVSRAVEYNNANYSQPDNIIEGGAPEGAVGAAQVYGQSEDNAAPLDEDNVAGEPLNDGYKDPADKIEDPKATDVTPEDASGISSANERGKSSKK